MHHLCPRSRRHPSLSRGFAACQALVRFFALHRIKPHAPPLVRAPVNSFEFHSCERTPQAGYLTHALRPIIPDNACILCLTAAAAGRVSRCLFLRYRHCFFSEKKVHDPWAFYLHAALLRQAFAHCGKFPTAASRRSLGRVSVPVWLIILSDQLLIIALTRAPPRADSSFCSSAYGVLAAVSSCCSPPKGRFLRVTHPSATGNTTSRPTCMC
ncbi:hypothetical protein H6P81_021591 [Aristolochia fimbriata]|uniref:Uncharacterized protein n=1 Tax=Aristolochia fimbriata TaxID=158543 RepID=A0AAV7DU40_ARIFI|nr:hypothetical protein H6P81_021591 [Aristolochia fimbriata]